ncbi:MAG TPA: GldG family protein [Firmicutes bacterium]|nr:GldG family protein [Bacillota bacterium]
MKNENTPEREELRDSDSLPETENKDTQAAPAAAEEAAGAPAPSEEAAQETPAENPAAQEAEAAEDLAAEEPAGENAGEEAPDGADGEDPKDKKKKSRKERVKKDTRKLRYGGIATALTVVVIAVVVLVNVVANILNERFPINLDLTADKLFTLGDESREIVSSVDKDVEIVVFAEESTLANSSTDGTGAILKQLHELLGLYQSYSGGKIDVTYVDLNSDPTLMTRYSEYEVTSYDVLFLCGDRHQKISMNDMFTYDETSYYYYGTLNVTASKVEQMMASNLMMVTSDETPQVLFLTGHGEDAYATSGLKALLEVNNYEPVDLDITGSEEYSDEAVMAFIVAPEDDYSDSEIEALRTWLDNGGKRGRHLMVLVNYAASCPNLYEFLSVEYGLEVTDNLVQETDANRVYQMSASYVYGDVGSSDYLADIAGSRVLMPITRQILPTAGTDTNSSLFNTSLLTFPESAKLVRMADAIKDPDNPDQEAPEPFDADEYPIVGGAMATSWIYDSDNNRIETNVIVLGSSAMAYETITGMSTVENEAFLLGLTNGITGNENPVDISNKPLQQTSLEFTTAQQNIFFFVFVVAVPLVILIVCLVVFLRRRRL